MPTASSSGGGSLHSDSSSKDIHADLTSRAILLRMYAQQGRLVPALAIDSRRTRGAINAVVAEFFASRALVLACACRTDEARERVEQVRDSTSVIEMGVLLPAVDAVCSVREGSSDVVDRALALEDAAFRTGAVDLLVATYRSCPELLAILMRASRSAAFRDLVELVGDHDLARKSGHPIAVNEDRRLLLTPRETEVYEILRTGVSNREIARVLFIEESTVKAHTHRIYDKLGVRSRSALAIQAALERVDQATSATDSTTDSDSP